jgi:hypothetical protein
MENCGQMRLGTNSGTKDRVCTFDIEVLLTCLSMSRVRNSNFGGLFTEKNYLLSFIPSTKHVHELALY